MTYQRTTATERPYRRPAPGAATGPLQRLWAAQDLAPLPIYLLAAVLCLAIAVIHIQDQGGFLGNVTPEWIAVGYYVVEAVAAVAALLFARQHSVAWLLGLAVSAGPATGYILSRSVGLPGDSGDVGNWGYVLGTVSLVAEGTLFVLCAAVVIRAVANERARLEPRRPSLAANL